MKDRGPETRYVFVVCFLLSVGCSNGKKIKVNPSSAQPNAEATTVNATTFGPQAPILVPGQSIGPIRIGMSKEDVARLGLEVKAHPSGQLGDDVRLVGPYYVVFDHQRVASVAFTLTGSRTGITIGGRPVPATGSLEDLAKALPDCGRVEQTEGGAILSCGGGTTIAKSGSENSTIVEVQVLDPRLLGG